MWEEEEDVSIFSPSHPDQSVSRGLEREQYENSMLNCCLINNIKPCREAQICRNSCSLGSLFS